MKIPSPYLRDLLLIGGGHAHVQVLKRFAMQPEPGVRLTLISRESETPYTGMLPGFIAKDYSYDDIIIDLFRLSRFANCRFIEANVESISKDEQLVRLSGGRSDMHYDVLSLNVGGDNDLDIPGGHFIEPVKPIGRFVKRWSKLSESLQHDEKNRIAIIGGGPGSVELAIALRQRLGLHASIVLLTRSDTLVPEHHDRVHKDVEDALNMNNIEIIRQFDVVSVQRRTANDRYRFSVISRRNEITPVDYLLSATGVLAPGWIRESGLPVDQYGCIEVNSYLQSTGDSNIFAVGDAASMVKYDRPKSGVYAVRQGPYLAENLRRQLTGQRLKKYRPQRQALAMLRTASNRAIASRGVIQIQGEWVWRYKNWIDRRFISKFQDLPAMSEPEPEYQGSLQEDAPQIDMRCGGCGAKLGADMLERVLHRLDIHHTEDVEAGIGEDAAVVNFGTSKLAISCDGFRSMIDDPWRFGRIAAHHALSDLYAMNSHPAAALALITVPLMSDRLMEEDLYQLMSGALSVFQECQVQLVGGHTAEGAELSVGFSVFGSTSFNVAEKKNLQPNGLLVLTKPIGVGVLLAGGMDGRCNASEVAQALNVMDQSNAPAAKIFEDIGVNACTDVTGFGLGGHLLEMLRASGVGARIDLKSVPMLAAAEVAMGRGIQSSLQQNNEQALNDCEYNCSSLDVRLRMLADPQTSGGLLASLNADSYGSECIDELKRAGYEYASIIGQTTQWLPGSSQLTVVA